MVATSGRPRAGNGGRQMEDAGRGLLKIAHREGNRWVAEIVDENYAGYTSSLQINEGTLRMTYVSETGPSNSRSLVAP